MKLKKRIEKLKRLRNRYLSSKTAALYFVNRKMKSLTGEHSFGTLTDLRLDRVDKNIELEVMNDDQVNTIAINGYGFTNKRGTPYLTWQSASFSGPEADHYRGILNKLDGIELSKRYVSLIEAVL